MTAQTGRQALLESQQEKRSGALARLGISSEDEARKLGILGKLPGQELAIGGLSGQAQQAQQGTDLASARLGQLAGQFDVDAGQKFQQFQTGGLAEIGLFGSQQATQFGAGQLLASTQDKAAGGKTQTERLGGFFSKFGGLPAASGVGTALIAAGAPGAAPAAVILGSQAKKFGIKAPKSPFG